MKYFSKHSIIILFFAAFLIAAFLGFREWKAYSTEKENLVSLQKEEAARLENKKKAQEEARDTEIAELKRQLEELKNKPIPAPISTTITKEVEAKDGVADIVKKWSPRVAYVKCSWYTQSGALRGTASGSATLVNFTNLGIRAITSRHIFQSSGDGILPRECNITPTNKTSGYVVPINDSNVSIGVDQDWAYISLPGDAALTIITRESVKLCPSVDTGDKLLVLGYPKIGSTAGLTATEGIVSGTDGDYYITSAKIDKGNSGGAAILVKDNCYLGIPSSSVVGTIESLGRILKAGFVIN